jgi:hypothetical protein
MKDLFGDTIVLINTDEVSTLLGARTVWEGGFWRVLAGFGGFWRVLAGFGGLAGWRVGRWIIN